MGYRLASDVYTKWRPILSRTAADVLQIMAITALDDPSEKTDSCLFFDKRDVLISAIRQTRGGKPSAREQTLKRALKELTERGAIKRINRAHSGSRQEYRLTLDAKIDLDWQPPSHKKKGVPQGPPSGGTPGTPLKGVPQPELGGTPGTPPKMYQLQVQNLKEETTPGPRTDLGRLLTPARDENETHNQEMENLHMSIPDDGACGNPLCIIGYIPNPQRTKQNPDRNIRCPTCRPQPPPRWNPANVQPAPRRRHGRTA